MLEYCETFKSIQKDTSDPVIVANKFIKSRFPLNVVKLELTRLLLDSSGFREPVPEHLVTREDLEGILDWVDEKSPNIFSSAIPSQNSKYFKRCTSFFERIFILDWNTFTNEGHFDTYFNRLLDAFSHWDPAQLHAISFAVKLKLVTAYLRGASVEDGQKSKQKVMQYCAALLKKAIYYKTIQCPISATAELYEWIKMDDSFATDVNMKLITLCLKMEKSVLTCHSLSIAYSLLRMEHLRENLTLFVRKLVNVFEDLCFTESNNVFEWICRCCEFIYKYHESAMSQMLMDDLLDNLFAKDRQKGKSVAGFWISSVFHPCCHRTNIRIILKFLADKGSEHWRVLVDSIIDDYQTIANYKLLVRILLDEDDEVPEEIRLTDGEKGGLVVLMAYAIQETVTGFPPEYRSTNMKKLNITMCNEFAREATEALVPCFWKLFHLNYWNKEHIQVMLIYIVKFFDFTVIESKTLIAIVNDCLEMFENSRQPFCFQAVMDMLKAIVSKVEDKVVVGLCDLAFRCLKEFCESELMNLVNNFVRDPSKYSDPNSQCVQTAEAVLVRIMSINRIMILNRTYAFELPLRMLCYNIPPHDPVFLSILYVCASLFSQHIHHTVADLKKLDHKEQKSLEEHEDIMRDIELACKIFTIKLIDWYPWTNLSVPAFFSLCKIAEAVRTLPLAQDTWNSFLPPHARYLIAGFVAHMVWKKDERWGDVEIVDDATKMWILDGFLKMIEWKALPLFYAYDPMSNFHKQTAVMEKPLRKFLLEICASEAETDVADWLIKWMICMFQLSSKDCLDLIADFVELIYPIRSKIQNIIYHVNLKGIDFALSETEDQISPASNHEFLNVLAKLCESLDESKKNAIETYFKRNTFKKNDVKVLKSFIKRLKKKSAPRKVDKSTPKLKSVMISSPILSSQRSSYAALDESLPIWSPSSVSGSSSMLADESDVESACSSLRLMIRSCDGNNVTNLANVIRDEILTDDEFNNVPSIFSAPVEEPNARTENTLDAYDDAHKLLKSLHLAKNSSLSSENASDILKNPTQSSTRVKESGARNVNKILKHVQMASVDACAIANSSSMSGVDNGGVLLDPSVLSTSAVEFDNQIVNTSQVYGNVSKLLMSVQSPDNYSMCHSPSMAASNENSADNILRNISKPVVERRKANKSLESHQIESINEYVTDEDLLASALVEGTVQVSKNSSIPSALKKEPDTQIESTSQVYDQVDELLKNMQTPSLDDYTVAECPSKSASSGEIVDFAKNPSMPSPLTTEFDGQSEYTSQQIFDNVNELLNMQVAAVEDDVAGKITSVTEPSGEFEVDDILNNQSIYSSSPKESDDEAESTFQAYRSVRELVKSLNPSMLDEYSAVKTPSESEFSESNDCLQNLANIPGEGERPGNSIETGGRISDVVKNMQKVSLSGQETESSDSSFVFGTSPTKKRRRFRC